MLSIKETNEKQLKDKKMITFVQLSNRIYNVAFKRDNESKTKI